VPVDATATAGGTTAGNWVAAADASDTAATCRALGTMGSVGSARAMPGPVALAINAHVSSGRAIPVSDGRRTFSAAAMRRTV
jgi:hypothetical protein